MSRITGPRLLKQLTVNRSLPRFRTISSSASASTPSAFLGSEARRSVALPTTIAELKIECRKRGLRVSGNKAALIDRLSISNDGLHSRSFIMQSSPSTSQRLPGRSTNQIVTSASRDFNTTAPVAAVGDNSTIDFMFLPEMPPPPPRREWIKVPFLPDNYSPERAPADVEAIVTPVMKPEINIMVHDGHVHAPSVMAEVSEASDVEIDPYDLAQRVGKGMQKEIGTIKTVWRDFLDDLFGGGAKPKSA